MNSRITARPGSGRPVGPALVGLLLGSALLLTGCGAAEEQGIRSDWATVGATPPADTGAAPTTEDAVAGGSQKVSAEEFCAALRKLQPELEKIGSADGAMAQLAIGISNVWGEKDALPELGAAPLDEMAAQSCPKDGAAALKVAGIESFDSL